MHLTERRGESGETLDEQVDRLIWIGEDAADEGAELMLVAGDIFDAASTPAERNAMIGVVRRWSMSETQIVIVRGNHDRAGDLDYLQHLDTYEDVLVYGYPQTGKFGHGLLGAVVGIVPWPNKGMVVAQMGADKTAVDNTALAAMRSILLGFNQAFEQHDGPRILLGHLELGCALADGSQPMTGRCEIELGADDLLATGADYVALGHIHRRQTIGDRICYAGSPRQTTFGDPETDKGYALVDVERGRPPEIDYRVAPGRRLVTIDGEWCDDGLAWDRDPTQVPSDAIVRLKYTVDESNREAAAVSANTARDTLTETGTRKVKIDSRILPVTRVRSEAIAEASTTADRLRAWWATRGDQPPRAEQVLAKLGQLESAGGGS
jgi:exonuclease SbcD